MDFETLSVEIDGPLGRLTLDRPDKLNPLGATTLRELARAARWFDERDGVKVVVVRGAGRAFSAGADLAAFSGPQQGSPRDAADLGREMADALEAMRAVAIAAILSARAPLACAERSRPRGRQIRRSEGTVPMARAGTPTTIVFSSRPSRSRAARTSPTASSRAVTMAA